MKLATYHISEPYFSFIQKGDKTIEGRVLKNSWKDLKINDTLIFKKNFNSNDVNDQILVQITYAKDFKSLIEMVKCPSILPDIVDEAEPWKIYNLFYNDEDISTYSVAGFHIKVVPTLNVEDKTF